MGNSEAGNANTVGTGIRVLAITAGCFMAAGGCGSGEAAYCLIVSMTLVLGALIQPYLARAGKLLMWTGAFFLSVMSLFGFLGALPRALAALCIFRDWFVVAVMLHSLASLLLIISCDVVLLADYWNRRAGRPVADQLVQRNGQWLVWFATLILTLWLLAICVLCLAAYRRSGGSGILLASVALGIIVTLGDVALAIKAVKMWRQSG